MNRGSAMDPSAAERAENATDRGSSFTRNKARNISVSNEPKMEDGGIIYEKIRVESATDLISSHKTTNDVFCFTTFVYVTQITVLIAAIVIAAGGHVRHYNVSTIAIGGIYATLAVLAEGYRSAEKMLFIALHFLVSVVENKANSVVRLKPMNVFFMILEGCVIVLSIFALLASLPQQGSIINIVLNCTAIIAVSRLDDALFENFHFNIYVPEGFDRNELYSIYDEVNNDIKCCKFKLQKFLPIAAGASFYVGLILLTLQWNMQCSLDVNCN